MGPSVKFVLTIIDAFPDPKNGGNFFGEKRTNRGWGGGGVGSEQSESISCLLAGRANKTLKFMLMFLL